MDKQTELIRTINDLRVIAAAIAEAADWLKKEFCDESSASEKPAITLEDVRAVLAEKSKSGHSAEVKELLKKYGASKLSEVDPKDYEALIQDAEAITDAA